VKPPPGGFIFWGRQGIRNHRITGSLSRRRPVQDGLGDLPRKPGRHDPAFHRQWFATRRLGALL